MLFHGTNLHVGPIKTIMRAGRWKQINTVMEYIEATERFSDSAATSVLLNMKNENEITQ